MALRTRGWESRDGQSLRQAVAVQDRGGSIQARIHRDSARRGVQIDSARRMRLSAKTVPVLSPNGWSSCIILFGGAGLLMLLI